MALLLGSSPPSACTKDKGARAFIARLRHDPAFDTSKVVVGVVETEEQPERRSGVEAWSMRLQERLVELPLTELLARHNDDQTNMPFHRIAYLRDRHSRLRLWESEHHRRWALGPAPDSSPAGACMHLATPGSDPRASLVGAGGVPRLLPSASAGGSGTAAMARAGGRRGSCGWAAGDPCGVSSCGRTAGASDCASDSGGGGAGRLGCGSDEEEDDQEEDIEEDVASMGQTLDGDGDGAAGTRGAGGASSAVAVQPKQQEEQQRELSLPEECWMKILHQLDAREVCMMSRINRWLRQLCGRQSVWAECHLRQFGEPPPADWTPATTKRMCRRSQLRVARWAESEPLARMMGSSGTRCLALDDTKVVSGDGSSLRVWSHVTGRRIATLTGHTGRVVSVAFDEELVVSGCTQATVKVWAMDDLKCMRTLKGHEGAITGLGLLPGGIPCSGSEDGTVLVWDTASSQPILRLSTGQPLCALQVHPSAGYLVVAGSTVQIWDLQTAQLLHTLRSPQEQEAFLQQQALAGAWHHVGDDSGDEAAFEGLDEELLAQQQQQQARAQAAGGGGSPFTCVSYSGHLLAAGRAEELLLWDVRSQQHIGAVTRSDWQAALSAAPPPPPSATPLAAYKLGSPAARTPHLAAALPKPSSNPALVRISLGSSPPAPALPAGHTLPSASTTQPTTGAIARSSARSPSSHGSSTHNLAASVAATAGIPPPPRRSHTPQAPAGFPPHAHHARTTGPASSSSSTLHALSTSLPTTHQLQAMLAASPPSWTPAAASPSTAAPAATGVTTFDSADVGGKAYMSPSCFASPLAAALVASAVAEQVLVEASGACAAWQCAGVQLDAEWKMVVAINAAARSGGGGGVGRGALLVHDVRAASSSRWGGAWRRPLMVLHAPTRINCFQFHSQLLLGGLEGKECCFWSMEPPRRTVPGGAAVAATNPLLPQLLPVGGAAVGGGGRASATSRIHHHHQEQQHQQPPGAVHRQRDGAAGSSWDPSAGYSGGGGWWDEVYGRSPPLGLEGEGGEERCGGRGKAKKQAAKQAKKHDATRRYPKRNGK